MTDRCRWVDCDGKVLARHMCIVHYSRVQRAGKLADYDGIRSDPQARFWLKVNKTAGCWLWLAQVTAEGYGHFKLDGRMRRAHRLSYEWLRESIPEGLHLDHLCRVRHCVNPWHLEAVAPKVNTLRGVGAAALAARQTHCVNGHEFSPENTKIATTGQRVCRECRREVNRRYRLRRAGAK